MKITNDMRALVGRAITLDGIVYCVERVGYQRRTSGGPTHPVARLHRVGSGAGHRTIGAKRALRLAASAGAR